MTFVSCPCLPPSVGPLSSPVFEAGPLGMGAVWRMRGAHQEPVKGGNADESSGSSQAGQQADPHSVDKWPKDNTILWENRISTAEKNLAQLGDPGGTEPAWMQLLLPNAWSGIRFQSQIPESRRLSPLCMASL